MSRQRKGDVTTEEWTQTKNFCRKHKYHIYVLYSLITAEFSSFQEAISDKLNSSITASYWRVSRDIGAKLNVVNENTDGVVVFADSTLAKQLLHLVRSGNII